MREMMREREKQREKYWNKTEARCL